MNILFEEQGDFKVAVVLADNETSLQVETASGKRAKVKAGNVLLRFEGGGLASFLPSAQKIADSIDVDFLWQCCSAEEFGFEPLAADYFGHPPSAQEAAGLLLKLHAAPMYFYRRGKGRYKAAPEETLQAALAAVERKRRQAEQQRRYLDTLLAGQLPREFEGLRDQLLYKPERSSIEAKALESACELLKLTPAKLFARCGALPSVHDYHLRRFLFDYFPEGTDFPDIKLPDVTGDLPLAPAPAYSIDDAATTEIDDAFSVATMADGAVRVGVHIAVPALGIAVDSPLDVVARSRLSTVYMPGDKITMLPAAAIEHFTLSAGREVPALSFYAEFSPELELRATSSHIEKVWVEENLRHDTLETVFNEAALSAGRVEHEFGSGLVQLHAIAQRLEAQRGKAGTQRETRTEYNFHVDQGRVEIVERRRGSPIDTVVSELMILVNTHWAKLLDEKKWAAVFRSQQEGRVKISGSASPHQGLGVPHYIWASSPLRRYVDLINQRQLVALLRGDSPPYARNSEVLFAAMREFELAYDAYAEFQRQMERYWCLRWVEQENVQMLSATVLRDTLVRLDRLPLVVRVPSIPDVPTGSRVQLAVRAIDALELSVECEFVSRVAA